MSNNFRSKINSRLVALRMARRDVAKNKIQSMLVIFIIAIPVALAAFAFTYRESIHLTASEKVEYNLGQTQAKVRATAGPSENNYQYPDQGSVVLLDPDNGYISPPELDTSATLTDPRKVIPGYEWLTETSSAQQVKTKSGVADITVLEVEAWNKAFAGRFYDFSGTAPTSKDEVLVNAAAMKRLGSVIGSYVEFPLINQKMRIVGVIEDASASRVTPEIYVQPMTPTSENINLQSTIFYAIGDKPLSWTKITELNKFGIGVLSRSVLLSPPIDAQIPILNVGAMLPEGSSLNILEWLVLGPVVLFPVVILTGSAFSFAARRQVRSLAVMSSLGARKSTLRFVTIYNGLWLGFLGGWLGTLVGAIASFVISPSLTDGAKISYPGLHIPFSFLLAVVLGGAAIGALVSAIPARTAAKVDILNAIRGTRRDPNARKRTGVISLIMLIIGAAGLAIGIPAWAFVDKQLAQGLMDLNQGHQIENLIVLAAVGFSFLAIIGLLVGSSWVLIFTRFVFRRFGTSANYATNDLVYNRRRFTAVMASVIAASFVASIVIGFYYTIAKSHFDDYLPSIEQNQLQISPNYSEKKLNNKIELEAFLRNQKAELQHQLSTASAIAPVTTSSLVNIHRTYDNFGYKYYSTGELVLGAEGDVPYIHLDYHYLCPGMPASPEAKALTAAYDSGDWRLAKEIESKPKYKYCRRMEDNAPSSFTVATSEELRVILGGRIDSSAEAALAKGQAVVFGKGFLTDGYLQLDWYPSGIDSLVRGEELLYSTKYFPPQEESGKLINFGHPSRSVRLPAVLSSSVNLHTTVVISPSTAKRLGIDYYPQAVVVNYQNPLTVDQLDSLQQALPYGYNYEGGIGWSLEGNAWLFALIAGMFILSATVIALSLSQIESRPDQATLWAVGATKLFRSKVVAFQSFALTFVGGLFGALIGFSLVFVLSSSLKTNFEMPWLQVLALFMGIPTLSALLFLLVTPKSHKFKSRLSLD